MLRSHGSSPPLKVMGYPMIRRGEIYFANLDPTEGREQSGYRPVLVVSSDPINRQPLVVAVVAGTDAANVARDYPTNVRVSAREAGLPRDTVFLCFQLRSLDHARLCNPLSRPPSAAGIMPIARMAEVDQALKLVLNLR
jgi:mRNA interferase MazF